MSRRSEVSEEAGWLRLVGVPSFVVFRHAR